jgi:enoyl-CoA hydratase/carnithine racemase
VTADQPREPVGQQLDGPVLTVTLNRPERLNALDADGWSRLLEVLEQARDDDEVRVVVLTGAGGNFCSGNEVSTKARSRHPLHRMQRLGRIALLLHSMPKPVIAKVDGVAAGGGMNLALGCDFIVATPTARFSEIFVRRGLSLDFGGSWLLPRIVGMQQARRLALLGDVIDAEQAAALGIVTWIKPADEIDAFVDGLAARLSAGPPIAMAQTKALLNRSFSSTFEEALAAETAAQIVNFGTDAPAARRAFVEKTTAVFEGRWQL